MPDSVTMMKEEAGLSVQKGIIFSVEQMWSASRRTASVHSGWATTRARGAGLQGLDLVPREFHVNVAGAVPQLHGAAELAAYPRAQVLVRHEQDGAVLRSLGDNVDGIPGSDDDVRQGLHAYGAVDVRHDIIIPMGVLVQEGCQVPASQEASREHPASASGRTTVLSGLRILAVSAMK